MDNLQVSKKVCSTSTMHWHEDMALRRSSRLLGCKRRLDFDEPPLVCRKSRTIILGLATDIGAGFHKGTEEISICGTVRNEKLDEAKVVCRKNGNVEDNIMPLLESIERKSQEHINNSVVLGPDTPSPAVKGRILSRKGFIMSKIYPAKSRTRVQSKKYAPRPEEIENSYYYTRSIHCQAVNMIELMGKPEKNGWIVSVWKELMKKNFAENYYAESRLLYEKVQAFVSKVGAIQGRREFSSWKGSVLDSVIGAFLAQRVSDNQSSSAFMSLGVSFPQCQNCEKYSQQDKMIRGKRSNASSSQKQDMKGSMLKLGNESKKLFDLKEKETPGRGKLVSRLCRQQDQDQDPDPEGNDLKLRYEGKKTVDEYEKDTSTAVKVSQKENLKSDWNKLRIEHSKNMERSIDAIDYVDWDAVKRAKVEDISKAIAVRGMNIKLATRIKKFLNKLMTRHKTLDLEWVRNAPLDDSMDFLRSIYGIGLKSASCVQLLTLQQPAFPVDINVARVMVRLGWVPTPPNMSDELQMSMLEEYSSLHELIHQYLWPWLVTLDHKTLYELHCQMITFGKVFCTKKKPKCSECPMKKDCKYFEDNDIEDFGNQKTLMNFKQNVLKCKRQEDQEKEPEQLYLDGDTEAPRTPIKDQSSLKPFPKERHLNKAKTRIQHAVYELPDGHPILDKYDKLDPNDPYPYLLVTWESGQTDLDNSENPIAESTSSSHNSPEQGTQTVPGTIFIPCRTALRGKFPLDGTYFQMNEVFADQETAELPMNINCKTLLQLKRKTLYCGTNIFEISKGLSKDEIKSLFNEGYICTRGFKRNNLAPVSLDKRLRTSLQLQSKG